MAFAGLLSGLFRLLMRRGNSFRMRAFGSPMRLFITQLLIRSFNLILGLHTLEFERNLPSFGFFLLFSGAEFLEKWKESTVVICLLKLLMFYI